MVPPEFSSTLQVTAELDVPVTVAIKDCVALPNRVTLLGATKTVMSG